MSMTGTETTGEGEDDGDVDGDDAAVEFVSLIVAECKLVEDCSVSIGDADSRGSDSDRGQERGGWSDDERWQQWLVWSYHSSSCTQHTIGVHHEHASISYIGDVETMFHPRATRVQSLPQWLLCPASPSLERLEVLKGPERATLTHHCCSPVPTN